MCLVGSFFAMAFAIGGESLEERSDDEFKLARNLFRDAGDYGTTSQLFAEFIRNYPHHRNLPEARLLLARAYARSGRCEQAVPAYEQYLTEHPEHLGTAEARRERAVCWEQLGDYARAAEAHEEIQRLFPSGEFAAPALLDAAANYTKAQNLRAAVAAYDRLIAEYAGHRLASRARFNMARIAFASGAAERAQRLLDKVISAGRNAEAVKDAYLLTGRIQLFLAKPALAEQAYEALRKRYPRSDHADSSWFDLGDFAIAKAQFDGAVKVFDQARRQVSDPGLRRRAGLGAAEALRLSGRYRAALKRYRPLADDSEAGDPILASAQLGVAICYGHTDRFAEAIALFLGIIQKTATSETAGYRAQAMKELAALYRRRGDLTRSATWFRHYLRNAEDQDARAQAQVRLNLAQVLDAAGYSNDAIAQFRQLLHSDSGLAAQAQLGMARAYEHGGFPGFALREYLTFLECYPAHALAAEARRRVEYLREFTILDRSGLDRALRQAWLEELGGASRQAVRFRVANSLKEYHDFPNAVRQLQTYVADYAGGRSTAEAHFYLADCLQLLARQRRLEGFDADADSLRQVALLEFRTLAAGGDERWQRLAHFRLLDTDLEGSDPVERARLLEERLVSFRQREGVGPELRAAAELKLADALRAAATENAHWRAALVGYQRAFGESPGEKHAPMARFGAAVSRARMGETAAAVDSLKALLGDHSGGSLVPEVLFELGRALMAESRIVQGAARFEELLLAFPAFPERREVQMALAFAHFELGSYPAAISVLQQLQNSEPQGETGADIRRQLARAYERNGDDRAALELYERLLSTHPSAAYADSMRLAQARLMLRLDLLDEAIALFDELRGSENATVASAAARAAGDLHFTAGRFDRAFAAYESGRGITVDGLRAVCLYKLGRVAAARKIADSVLDQVAKGDAWYWILPLESGRYYLRSHNFGKGAEDLSWCRKAGWKNQRRQSGIRDSRRRAGPNYSGPGSGGQLFRRHRAMGAEPSGTDRRASRPCLGSASPVHPQTRGIGLRRRRPPAPGALLPGGAQAVASGSRGVSPCRRRLRFRRTKAGGFLGASALLPEPVRVGPGASHRQTPVGTVSRPPACECRAPRNRLHSQGEGTVQPGDRLSGRCSRVGSGGCRSPGPLLHRRILPEDGPLSRSDRTLLPRLLSRIRRFRRLDQLRRFQNAHSATKNWANSRRRTVSTTASSGAKAATVNTERIARKGLERTSKVR